MIKGNNLMKKMTKMLDLFDGKIEIAKEKTENASHVWQNATQRRRDLCLENSRVGLNYK